VGRGDPEEVDSLEDGFRMLRKLCLLASLSAFLLGQAALTATFG
jgi:hypothetical protein